MARVQRIRLSDAVTWTVTGEDYRPIIEVEIFLEYLRQTDRSPNTVKSYARALALWWNFLELRERKWSEVSIDDFGAFLGWVRTGLPPDVAPISEVPRKISESTVAIRLQGVRSFYRYHQLRGLDVAPGLFEWGADHSSFKPFLHHASRREASMRATVTVRRRRAKSPTLTPPQMDAIKDACAYYDADQRIWVGSVRDRLLFELLEQTGLRLGEALSLQHRDWYAGRGDNPFIEVIPRPHPHGLRAKSGEYRKLYVSDELDRLYAEYVWQLCDSDMDLMVASMDASYVFVNVAGGQRFAPMRPETVYKLVNRIKTKLVGQVPPDWTPHWFRHTHASAMLLSGQSVHVVSRRLGHSDVQTTLNTYAWVTDDEELRALADWKTITTHWRKNDVPPNT